MVIIETIGAGQDEVEIAGTAMTTILVNNPGTGDDIQALKAGISYKLTASVAGPPGPALVALTTGGTVVEVTLATNVNGEIASDALTIQSLLVALAAANPGVFTTALAGS